jgi:hypothetical protein
MRPPQTNVLLRSRELVDRSPIAIVIGGEMAVRAGACSSGEFPAHTF